MGNREQMMSQGVRVHGELHSTDASSGAEIVLYDDDNSVRAIASDEQLEVDSLSLIVVATGDAHVFFDNNDDNVLDAGETIERGTFAANSGIRAEYDKLSVPRGALGAKPHVIAPAGVVDVQIKGRIIKPITKSGPTGEPIPDHTETTN